MPGETTHTSQHRRQFLVGITAAATAVLAGCLTDDEATAQNDPIDLVEATMVDALNEKDAETYNSAWHPEQEFPPLEEWEDNLEGVTFEMDEIELVEVDDDIAFVYLARTSYVEVEDEDEPLTQQIEHEFELRLYEGEWRVWEGYPVDDE